MLEKILVALDGSPQGERVLPFVEEIALRTQSQVSLFSAVDPSIPIESEEYSKFAKRLARHAKQRADDYLRAISGPLADRGLTVKRETVIGPVAQSILKRSESGGYGLVVMSSQGQGQANNKRYGVVAGRILHYSRVPILLINQSAPWPKPGKLIQTLVVPLDGSSLAERVLPLAYDLGKQFAVPLHLVQAVPTPREAMKSSFAWSGYNDEESDWLDGCLNRSRNYLSGLQAQALQLGVISEADAIQGDPVSVILHHIEKLDGAMITMSSAGSRGAMARWSLGSITESVIQECRVPILIYPSRVARHLRHSPVETN